MVATAMPVAFVAHGAGPMPVTHPATHGDMPSHLKALGRQVAAAQPKAILVVSAHHAAKVATVSGDSQHTLLYDYYGFSDEAYKLQYPVAGDAELAQNVAKSLQDAGVRAKVEIGRGLDHGVFIPLLLMLPEARIPVVQLSLLSSLDPPAHIAMGKALQKLRSQGVLILGTGMSYHNMRGFDGGMAQQLSGAAGQDSARFDKWLEEAVCGARGQDREQKLAQWADAPAARACHPLGGEEHLLPLHVCVGAAGSDAGARVYDDVMMGVKIASFVFGDWPEGAEQD